MPSNTRKAMRAYIELAKTGVMNVERDHNVTARVRMFLPPYFLAALPPIT